MFSQQPAVLSAHATFGCVTEPAKPPARVAFSERLHELCGDMELPQRGRQTKLAKLFKVSQQAARKWLEADSFPNTDTIVAIADWGEVNVNWLLQGAGPKKGNRVDAKVLLLDEAVHSLTPEMGVDLIDNLRAKLLRVGRLSVEEPKGRYSFMLDAYQAELAKKRQQ